MWPLPFTLKRRDNRVAEDASIRRSDLLMQASIDVLAMGLDVSQSIQAQNSLERMLAHQLALAHDTHTRTTSASSTVSVRPTGRSPLRS